MQTRVSKKLMWILVLGSLFLGLTAPFNPYLTSKPSVYIWTFIIMGIMTVGVLIAVFFAYPPEEVSSKEEKAKNDLNQ